MNDVVFEYRLTGDGFFDALFRVGDVELDLRQLGDSPRPLDELMTAALALAQDEEPPPQLLWDPEDGSEYRWHFTRSADRLHINIAQVDANTAWGLPGKYRVWRAALDAECGVGTFCTVVAQRAAEVIARYGPERYAALALGSFPFELLEALQAAIALRPEQDGADP